MSTRYGQDRIETCRQYLSIFYHSLLKKATEFDAEGREHVCDDACNLRATLKSMIPPKQEERINSSVMLRLKNACPKELKLEGIYGII